MGGKSSKERERAESVKSGTPSARKDISVIVKWLFKDALKSEILYNKQGHFVNGGMSALICDYYLWIDYPKSEQIIRSSKGRQSRGIVTHAVVSSDDTQVFIAADMGWIRHWDLLREMIIHDWQAHSEVISALDCCENRVLSADRSGWIRVWDASEHTLIKSMWKNYGAVTCARFNLSGERVISGYIDSLIRIWSLKSDDECIERLLHRTWALSLGLDPIRPKVFLTGAKDKSISLWEFNNVEPFENIDHAHNNTVLSVQVNCDSSRIVSNCFSEIKIWDYYHHHSNPTDEKIGEISMVIRKPCSQLCCHPCNPKILAIAMTPVYKVMLIDIQTGDVIVELDKHTTKVVHLSFTKDGYRLISIGSNKTIRIMDVSHWIKH